MKKYLSVIIPTYNRAKTLEKCLKALSQQTYPKTGFEVIIADDGSTDQTAELVAAFIKRGSVDAKYFRQENKGPAAARNLGIKHADGEVILFIGDDIIAGPDLLDSHAAWHLKNPPENLATLGYVTWDLSLEITPFMHWLENGGPQFNFNELDDEAEADPSRFFYTCNISLKRSFLTEHGLFDEEFPHAAFEDVELGSRLRDAGLRLFFDRNAIAWHHHFTSLKDACERMTKVGESKKILDRKTGLSAYEAEIPFIWRVVRALKILLYYQLAAFFEKRKVAPGVFDYVMSYYYALGFENARARRR